MNKLIIWLLFSISLPIFAQNDFSKMYFELRRGKEYFLLADQVNLRKGPSLDENILENLPIGSKFTFNEESKETLTLRGLEAPWVKICYTDKGKSSCGYIWGGFIARQAVYSASDPKTLIMEGISGLKTEASGNFVNDSITVVVRVCRNNKEVDLIEVEGLGSMLTSIKMKSLGDLGVNSVKDIIHLDYSDAYCGGESGRQVLFLSKDRLQNVVLLHNGLITAGLSEKVLIYPNEAGGKKGKIILRKQEGYYNDQGKEVIEYFEDTECVWNGYRLIPQN